MKRYQVVFLTILLTALIIFAVFFCIGMAAKVDLNADEKNSVPISNNTVAFQIYVDGTKCIVTESDDHGAISCDWNSKKYK